MDHNDFIQVVKIFSKSEVVSKRNLIKGIMMSYLNMNMASSRMKNMSAEQAYVVFGKKLVMSGAVKVYNLPIENELECLVLKRKKLEQTSSKKLEQQAN